MKWRSPLALAVLLAVGGTASAKEFAEPAKALVASLLGIQGASTMLGIFEITTWMLLALCPIATRASVIGGAMAVFTFLITLSFFLTTPSVAAPMGFPAIAGHVGQFLLKDAGLLGISIWLLGGALLATTTHSAKNAKHRFSLWLPNSLMRPAGRDQRCTDFFIYLRNLT
jgi:Protein of unknown function, DUF417